MRFIVVDLEATCRESGMPRTDMETIEIGAVEWPGGNEFQAFIQPVIGRELSEFCKSLTGIRQTDVDRAETFPKVFRAFLDWVGGDTPYCERHGIPWPVVLSRHLNLKKLYAERMGVKPCGMAAALHQLGMPLVGRHHRGIDDARNIAAILEAIGVVEDTVG